MVLPPSCLAPQFHSLPHLSAMCSCLASSASLLKVFHIASVSGVISRVSRKAVALERGDSKAQGMLLGSGRHGGILAVGRRRGGLGNYLPFLSHLISSRDHQVLFKYGQFYNPILRSSSQNWTAPPHQLSAWPLTERSRRHQWLCRTQ